MITIIIPTKNRPDLLVQNLRYLTSLGMRVLVIDGSLQFNLDASMLTTQYIHAPGLCLSGRAKLALDHLTTKYFAFCADDDFICESGLQGLVDELDSNNQLAAVQGRHLQFFTDQHLPGKILPHSYDVFNDSRIIADDPLIRLFKINSFPINFYCYAVCRREVLVNFSQIAESVIGTDHSPVAFEPLMAFSIAISGNYKSINSPHLIRRPSKPWPNPSFQFLLGHSDFYNHRSKLIDSIFSITQSVPTSIERICYQRAHIAYALDQYIDSMKVRERIIAFRRQGSLYIKSGKDVLRFLVLRFLAKLRLLLGWHSVDKSFFESDEIVYARFISDSKYIYKFVNAKGTL